MTEAIQRDYDNGYSVLRLARKYGLKRSEVQRLLANGGKSYREKSVEEIRQRAIAELLAEGHSAELIAANFGG